MPLIVEPVPADSLLFDASQKLSRGELQALYDAGFRGGLRYVGLGGPAPEDIDGAELENAMAVGLGIMLVQHVRFSPWVPSAPLGQRDGQVACQLAQAAGYLPGAHLWDDLEGINPAAGSALTIAYANTKFDVCASEGYPQGEYIGYAVPLTSSELFHALKTSCYWRSFSNVPDVERRGYAMKQLVETTVSGVDVDISVSSRDRLGGQPHWMRFAA
jgi:hypothetical protein